MSRQFSIPTVLRMTPNVLLADCFKELGHTEFDPKWDELSSREIDPILDYLNDLPTEQLNEVEGVLRSVFELSCESGFHAMLAAAPYCEVPELGELVPFELTFYGRAMWVWLHFRRVFDRAQVIHNVENISWWRKRKDVPATTPDFSDEARRQLEQQISNLLKEQGRGKDCTVETLASGNFDYFFAYPDDFVQNVIIHDEYGKLASATFRQTLLIAFAYDREEGSLEMCAKLPKETKERLEAIFSSTILHWELGPHEPRAVYELNQLKDPTFELETDPADALRVSITQMRLTAKGGGPRITVERHDARDIHSAINDSVKFDVYPRSEWNVTQAAFCFEFLPLDGRKHGQHTFDVTFPRSCSLRNARPERVELIQKYMKRWKIDVAPPAETRSVAMGSSRSADRRGREK